MEPHLKICTPVYDTIPNQLIAAIEKLKEANVSYEWYRASGPLIFKNRNALVDRHGLEGFSHVVTWDTDTLATASDIKRLIGHGKEVVAAAQKFRTKNVEHYIAGRGKCGYVHSSTTGLIQVPFVSMGLCVIEVDVFNKIEKPYFCHLPDGETQTPEDVGFCMKVQDAGIEVWLDCDCQVHHGIKPIPKKPINIDGMCLEANEALTKTAAVVTIMKKMIEDG